MLIYTLGPNYVGQFTESLEHAQNYDLVTAANLPLYRSRLDLLNNIGNFSLSGLTERLVFAYVARDNGTAFR